MELKFTKRKNSHRIGYIVIVETIIGDGDKYQKYSEFFKELSNDFMLLTKYILDQGSMTEEDSDRAEDLYLEIMENKEHELHKLFFHWDRNADDWEEIQDVRILYTDEDGLEYDVEVQN